MEWGEGERVEWGGGERVEWGGGERVEWGGGERVDWGSGQRVERRWESHVNGDRKIQERTKVEGECNVNEHKGVRRCSHHAIHAMYPHRYCTLLKTLLYAFTVIAPLLQTQGPGEGYI